MSLTVWRTVLIGLVSTMSMDIFSVLAIRLRAIAPLAPNLVGRWFVSVANAQPFHTDIAHATPVSHELGIAFPVHYAIGTSLAALYVWATSYFGLPTRSPVLAVAFGVSTSVLPWLLMFPAMGYGIGGAHGPAGTRLFTSSLVTHAFFGAGIGISVRLIGSN